MGCSRQRWWLRRWKAGCEAAAHPKRGLSWLSWLCWPELVIQLMPSSRSSVGSDCKDSISLSLRTKGMNYHSSSRAHNCYWIKASGWGRNTLFSQLLPLKNQLMINYRCQSLGLSSLFNSIVYQFHMFLILTFLVCGLVCIFIDNFTKKI